MHLPCTLLYNDDVRFLSGSHLKTCTQTFFALRHFHSAAFKHVLSPSFNMDQMNLIYSTYLFDMFWELVQ